MYLSHYRFSDARKEDSKFVVPVMLKCIFCSGTSTTGGGAESAVWGQDVALTPPKRHHWGWLSG